MFSPDSTKVPIKKFHHDDQRAAAIQLKEYKQWFDERNIKYSFHSFPAWATYPTSVILRNEDALAFKLAFNL